MSEQLPEIDRLLGRAVDTARPVIRGIAPDQLTGTTPCAEYDVRRLLNHLMQVVIGFRRVAAKQRMELGDQDVLADDWRAQFDTESRRLIEAWSAPGALEGESAGLGLPQSVTVQLVLVDLVVHSWDLARATGQPVRPDPELVDLLFPTCQRMALTGRTMGAFGPEVEVPADAPTFDRLLGIVGRDPSWTPPR